MHKQRHLMNMGNMCSWN